MDQTCNSLYGQKKNSLRFLRHKFGKEVSCSFGSLALNIYSNFLLVWLLLPVKSRKLNQKSLNYFQLVIQVWFRFHIKCNHMRLEIWTEINRILSIYFITVHAIYLKVDYSNYGMVLDKLCLKLAGLAEMASW